MTHSPQAPPHAINLELELAGLVDHVPQSFALLGVQLLVGLDTLSIFHDGHACPLNDTSLRDPISMYLNGGVPILWWDYLVVLHIGLWRASPCIKRFGFEHNVMDGVSDFSNGTYPTHTWMIAHWWASFANEFISTSCHMGEHPKT